MWPARPIYSSQLQICLGQQEDASGTAEHSVDALELQVHKHPRLHRPEALMPHLYSAITYTFSFFVKSETEGPTYVRRKFTNQVKGERQARVWVEAKVPSFRSGLVPLGIKAPLFQARAPSKGRFGPLQRRPGIVHRGTWAIIKGASRVCLHQGRLG